MLRAAAKKTAQGGHLSTSCWGLHQAQRGLKTRWLQNELQRNRLGMLDVQGRLRAGVGMVRLNREHRYNTLTPHFTKQVARGVESMYQDHSVKLIYLSTPEGKHFCNGTDFKTLLHYKADGKDEKAADYLGDVFRLQATFAKTNKPIMSVAPGHSFNSGAGLLAASGFPAICHNSQVAFNECTFGFVPHAGTTYYASRLPGDFGTFLVLTGAPLAGKDAIGLGMADALIEVPETYEEEIAGLVFSMDPTSMPTARLAAGAQAGHTGNSSRQALVTDHMADQAAAARVDAAIMGGREDMAELLSRELKHTYGEPFIDPRERKPDVVAQADFEYKQLLRRFNNSKHGVGEGPGFFDHPAFTFNQYEYMHEYLRLHAGHIYAEDTVRTLLQHRQLIDRCFRADTVEEIMDNLQNESHPFAQEILKKMQGNSMLSMKLALKMLRKAQNLGYGEIMKMELNVALNKASDLDFELGVKEVLMKARPRTQSGGKLGARPNPGFDSDVSDAKVDSYFADNQFAKQIDLDIVENSLLPTRHFFQRFTDSVRVWINETSTPQEEVRDAVELEIHDALRAEGINLRDKTVTVPLAREHLFKKVRAERRAEEQERRFTQFITDKTLRTQYFGDVKAELKKLEQDPKRFYDLVNQMTNEVFENAYLERLKMVYDKSKEAQSLDKRRMFIRFKKFLMKSRVLSFVEDETEKIIKQVQALPFKQIHLTEDWATSHRDQEHPDLQQSVMWHLSKAIGKVSLAPAEMARVYLTDPEAAKSMQVYTFDKNELEKLSKDILANPDKYEQLLLKAAAYDPFQARYDPGGWLEKQEAKVWKRLYRQRLVNDGKLTEATEHWPMRVEYHNYRVWAESIQSKALGTLKHTVNRLLLDFEKDESLGNEVVDFERNPKETKRAALQRLLTLLNERAPPEVVEVSADSGASRGLRESKRALKDMRKDFNALIDQDQELSSLFGLSKSASKSQMVQDFRDQLLGELLQLVETTLIQSQAELGKSISKDLLEKRLAEIGQPSNLSQDRTASLRIIDSFLAQKSGKSVLKQAISVVKPFFIAIVDERLKHETQRVLEGFGLEHSADGALRHFLFNLRYPGQLRENEALKKLNRYHVARERAAQKEREHPEQGKKYKTRELLGMLGVGNDSSDPSESLNNTRNQLRGYKEYMECLDSLDHAIDEEYARKREDLLKIPFDQDAAQQPVPENYLTESEIEQLARLREKRNEVQQFIVDHQYELTTMMSEEDWLDVYSRSVKDFGLDMDHLIRETKHPERYQEDLDRGYSQIELLRNRIGGDENLTWEVMAEYAGLLSNLSRAQRDIASSADAAQNFEKMMEFMAANDRSGQNQAKKGQGKKKESAQLSRESIFRAMTKARYDPESAVRREDRLRQEINSFGEIQKRIEDQSKLELECLRLAKFAPLEVREYVDNVLSSKSKYLDLGALSRQLARRDYSRELDARDFIDKERLLRDVLQGTALNEFMDKYQDATLDVVSLAEMRSLIEAAKPTESLSNALVAQIRTVLQHVDEQMRYVDHERRSQITLGEFMGRHHYLNASSLQQYSSDLLKNQIESTLGRAESQTEAAAAVDLELGGINSSTYLSTDGGDLDGQLFEASRGASTPGDGVSFYDGQSGKAVSSSEAEILQKTVFREARRLAELSPEMTALKNGTENQLMALYMQEDLNPKEVEVAVQQYTQARLKDCLLKPDFAKAVRTANGHIYLKVLRENILDELKLAESAKVEEFDWVQLAGLPRRPIDVESKYNLNHINNEKAIGYRNLEERAANLDDNQNIAHETVFDKMLADYFLQKRGDYKSSNQLLTDLEGVFGKKKAQESGAAADDTLGNLYLQQQMDKEDMPELPAWNFPALMELDLAVSSRLHDGKAGLSQELRDLGDDEDLDIPAYFELGDARKSPELYVQDQLRSIIDKLFGARRRLEKHLGRAELIAYDQVLAKYLKHDVLFPKLQREAQKEWNALEQGSQMAAHAEDNERSMEKQARKTRNTQQAYNKEIVNEDAFYKLLAYTGTLEKKRRENIKETLADPAILAGVHSFDQKYQRELERDIKRPARPINPEDFVARRQRTTQGPSDRQEAGYLDEAGRREQFIDEHQRYKEGRLEEQERAELFYVLEQFFEKSRRQPAAEENTPLHAAQEHLREYFSQPENTQFFDKNKIR